MATKRGLRPSAQRCRSGAWPIPPTLPTCVSFSPRRSLATSMGRRCSCTGAARNPRTSMPPRKPCATDADLMRIVVFGAGAIGGVIAGRLFEQGNDVIAIARGAHFEASRASGLRLVDPDREVSLAVPFVDDPGRIEWHPDDVVLLATKTQDSIGAFDALVAAAGTRIPVVCVQNGVANE